MYCRGSYPGREKQVFCWLEYRIAVFERDDGTMAFIAPELKNGYPIVIGVSPVSGRSTEHGGDKMHVIMTAHSMNRGRLPAERWVSEDLAPPSRWLQHVRASLKLSVRSQSNRTELQLFAANRCGLIRSEGQHYRHGRCQ